jgi:hypothetical protein
MFRGSADCGRPADPHRPFALHFNRPVSRKLNRPGSLDFKQPFSLDFNAPSAMLRMEATATRAN